MAKENKVTLYGQVFSNIKVIREGQNDEPSKVEFKLKVLRRTSFQGQIIANHLKYDYPIITTRNPAVIKQALTLKAGDMIDLEGVISTREVKKIWSCPKCGAEHIKEGNLVYITPIFLCKREAIRNIKDGEDLLKSRAEISNEASVIGTLCRDPIDYTDDAGKEYTQYQLAMNRRFRIKEDPESIKTDYPWVKTYGAQAVKDRETLHVGSLVYLDTAIQTRDIPSKKITCDECGHEYEVKESVMEMVPYIVKPLSNCNVEEDDIAKENKIRLHGQVAEAININYNEEGTPVLSTFIVKTMRRSEHPGQLTIKSPHMEFIPVRTQNQEMIKIMSTLQPGDMVDIKGVLSTRGKKASCVCPKCKQKFSVPTIQTYVTPIYICRREQALTVEEGFRLLKERAEISNRTFVIGTLIDSPVLDMDDKGRQFARYQMAVSRAFRIKEDPELKKEDYPCVRTSGRQALEDTLALHKGSLIYLDAALQEGKRRRTLTCEHCNASFDVHEKVLEMVPYSTEYLKDCDYPEKDTDYDDMDED